MQVKHILETSRLILREMDSKDAKNFYDSNPNVIKYTGNSAFKNIEEAKEFLENYTDYKFNGSGRWAVILKTTDKFIGWCGLKFDELENETDIGFRFFEEEWNKGYATESAIACIHYGFEKLKLKRIIGRAMKENVGSIKVLEKIGLEYEKNAVLAGKDAVIYKIEK
jgi:ribosomal-protein-alanine N-acetyltransferase